jgi:predicted DNA-binding protein YlxM (UPF0122 family)
MPIKSNFAKGYIYEVIHKPTGLTYVGKRWSKSNPEDDNYFGSGVEIRKLLGIHPIGEFRKKILEKEISSEKDLNNAEDSWIDIYRDELGRYEEGGLCINVADGGDGGIRMFGENNPMFGKERPDTAEFNRREKTIGVIDIDTQQTWETELKCANDLGVTKGAVSRAARGLNKLKNRRLALNTVKGKEFIQSAKFYKPGENNRDRQQKPIGIIETNICFRSVRDAANLVGRAPSSITNAIARNGRCADIRFEFISIEDYNRKVQFQESLSQTSKLERASAECKPPAGGNRRKSVRTKDGSRLFPSVSDAARHFKVSKSAITNSIKRGSRCKGVLLKYGEGIKIVGRVITVREKHYPSLQSACEHHMVNYETVCSRLKRNWSIDEAFGITKRLNRSKNPISVDGIDFESINQACDYFGIKRNVVNARRNKLGWSNRKALKTPVGIKKRPSH